MVCGAWSCVVQVGVMSVTNEKGWPETCNRDLADVQRAPRFVALLFVIQAEGFQAKGKDENQSNSTGVRMKVQTPRLVARFMSLLMKIVRMKVSEPRFVAWSFGIRSKRVQAEGEEAKCSS